MNDAERARMEADCDFEHPHPDHPCGRHVIEGVTRCGGCGELDGSPECHCWIPATQAHLDSLICEAMESGEGLS